MIQMTTPFAKQRFFALLLALIVLVLDFASKKVALHFLSGGDIISVIEGFFNFRLAFNTGVSFSMFAGSGYDYMPHILGTMSFIASAGFVFWLFSHKSGWFFAVSLALVIGGALGNGIDRFFYGAVVDFIDIYYATYHWPTFNVADICICLGVGLLILESLIESLAAKKEKKEEKTDE